MGKVSISCCGDVIYYNHGTSGGQAGIARCPRCGCVYGWKDIGSGQTKTWTEQSCPRHGFDNSKIQLCPICNGRGSLGEYICKNCKGTGLIKIWV